MNRAITLALAPPPAMPATISTLLLPLLTALEEEEITYCCWKSSRRLALALNGTSDLDLLVARTERWRAARLLIRCGFKHWTDVTGRDHPAVWSFLGHDEESGAIHHVHVHCRLVVGNSMLKAYRLPCEAGILRRSVRHPAFPVKKLDPVDEALLLTVRAHLERSPLDPIAFRQRKAIFRKFAEDRAVLAPLVSRSALLDRAAEMFSAELARAIADDFVAEVFPCSGRRLRTRIEKELFAYRMYNGVEVRLRTFARTMIWGAGEINKRFLRWPRPWGRRASGGGVVISFVGMDGSGKSTLVAMTRSWLGRETDVLTYYMGTGDGRPSLILLPLKKIVPLIAHFIKTKPKGASHGNISDRPPGFIYSVLFGTWAVAVALDKRHKIIAARRAASRGFVVVTDRYPQNENDGFNDGPLLPRLSHVPVWLRRFESSVYGLAQHVPPDLVLKLLVGPETVARREPDMSPELVERRIAWLNELRFAGARVVSVDARQPLEEVVRVVKREIWSLL